MAKRKRKTYKRYSVTAFLSGFLCFVLTALIIASLFFTFFGYAHNTDPMTTFKGVDFLFFGLKLFIPVGDRFNGFTSFFQQYVNEGGASYLLKPIAQFHDYFDVAVVFFYALALVFALIEALLGLFWFITGRLILPKSSKVIAWITTVFYWVALGLFIGYLYIYKAIIDELGEYVVLNIAEMPFIIGTLMLFTTIAINIIYAAAYKNRRLAKKQKPVYEEDEVEQPTPEPVAQPEPAPQPESEPEPQPQVQTEDWICPFCGSKNKNTNKFCTNCGGARNGKYEN